MSRFGRGGDVPWHGKRKKATRPEPCGFAFPMVGIRGYLASRSFASAMIFSAILAGTSS